MIKVNFKWIFLLALFLVIFSVQNLIQKVWYSASKETLQLGSHQVKFFEKDLFNQGAEQAKNARAFENHIYGGIIPHDLFPSFIAADFFKRLSYQKPTTIILVGPNHYEKGDFKALTSQYSWQTPFGIVFPDLSIIKQLIAQNLVQVDENVLPNDHAVAGSIPFINFYLPQVKVVPILLSGTMTQKECRILADSLSKMVSKDVVLVAPVDFSHYLTSKQAKEKDKVTYQTLLDFNYQRLFLMDNNYLDSPPSIGTLLMIMQTLGKTKMDLLFHTNSGELQKNEYIPTTSYFAAAFLF